MEVDKLTNQDDVMQNFLLKKSVSYNSRLKAVFILTVLLTVISQSACTGLQTLSNAVRAGDTVTVAVGRQINATRDNTIVTITDSAGVSTTYNPGHPNVKAILNLYPDPVSYQVVGTETEQELRNNVLLLGIGADGLSQGTRDWWLTIAIIDLPQTMALGTARIKLDNNGSIISNARVEIIAGTGSPHGFDVQEAGANGLDKVVNLERAPHYKVTISNVTGTQPQAIDFKFTHDPDINNGGSGKMYVTNPLSNKTSLVWSDDGTNLHVIVTAANAEITNAHTQFGFYIAGGITGLNLASIEAADINGNIIPDVTAFLSPGINSLSPAGPILPGSMVSIMGENLCNDCINPDTEVWLKSGGAWSQITPLSIDSNLITLQIPVDSIPGDGTIWVSTLGGTTDYRIQIQ